MYFMIFLSIMHHYLAWHYTRAYAEIFHVWLNLMWFTINFFSIPQLMGSWFSPWKRMIEKREEGAIDFESIASVVVVGILSRLIGFVMRSIIIGVGCIVLLLVVIGGFLTYLFWIAAPLILIGLIGFGITLIAL